MLVRAAGGKTPGVSDHPSRPSAEPNEVDIQALIEIAKRDQTVLKGLVSRDYDLSFIQYFIHHSVLNGKIIGA